MFSMQKQLLIIGITGLLIVTALFATYRPSISHDTTRTGRYSANLPEQTKRLHMVVPATEPNLDFCRFLLSSAITGYPDPILIGWKEKIKDDGHASHLFKVVKGLEYLTSLPAEQDDDLVLMLDAYDIWLLLRPEVMISRYYRAIATQADRLRQQGILGKSAKGVPIENTLLFGADKVCWPRPSTDPGCWALPDSPMREKEYGPDTDSWMVPNRPKWLNSGTLIGPAGHMRDFLNATMENVNRTFDEQDERHGSDQFYMSDVWAEQEVTRMKIRDGRVASPVIVEGGVHQFQLPVPKIPEERRTEYHVSADHGVELFQTAAGFTEYLTWMSFNNTTPMSKDDSSRMRRLDQLELPEDISKSKPPFEARLEDAKAITPVNKGWKDIRLGVNVVQQTVWPLFHVTGDKDFRDRWWPYVWWHPHGEAMIEDASAEVETPDSGLVAVVDGVKYVAADTSGVKSVPRSHRHGGGWSDAGDRFEWPDLCGEWQNDPGLFVK